MNRALLSFLLLLPSILVAEERAVIPGGPGPNRLDPDAAFLAAAQPIRYSAPDTAVSGFGDLRLHDRAGHEIPYLFVGPRPAREEWTDGRIVRIPHTKITSGFELDLGAIRRVDRLRLDGLEAPLMKRLSLEGSGDRSHYATLASDATVFDLPDDKLRHLDVEFEPGEYRYLRVTWNDRNSAVVRQLPVATARVHRNDRPEEHARQSIAFRTAASGSGKTHYRLQLPGSSLPIAAIELVATNENVLRSAVVSESRLSGSELLPIELGRATLRQASREGVTAANLLIPIAFPETADLDLMIDDGDNPPLAIERIDALFAPLPWIYFEAADTQPLTASYGDAKLAAPRYDLEALRASLAGLKPVPAKFAPAGGSRTVPAISTPGVFAGAPVKRTDYRHSRRIVTAPAGIARLLLDAEVLAHSSDCADVRIVDSKSVQIPYLVERPSDPLSLVLKVPARTEREGRSVYRFELPYDSLPASKLVVTTSARLFSRDVELRQIADTPARDQSASVLSSAPWRSADPDHEAPPLTLEAPVAGVKVLELIIDEGDNAPLPITSARLLVPSVALRFINPGTPVELLYGNSKAVPPKYDIELLASRIFASPARDLSLAPATASAAAQAHPAMQWFWLAVVAVVLALFFVLVRLIGAHEAEEPSS